MYHHSYLKMFVSDTLWLSPRAAAKWDVSLERVSLGFFSLLYNAAFLALLQKLSLVLGQCINLVVWIIPLKMKKLIEAPWICIELWRTLLGFWKFNFVPCIVHPWLLDLWTIRNKAAFFQAFYFSCISIFIVHLFSIALNKGRVL